MSTVNEARQKKIKHTKPKDVLSFRKLNMQRSALAEGNYKWADVQRTGGNVI